jgi:hypothetical protein
MSKSRSKWFDDQDDDQNQKKKWVKNRNNRKMKSKLREENLRYVETEEENVGDYPR